MARRLESSAVQADQRPSTRTHEGASKKPRSPGVRYSEPLGWHIPHFNAKEQDMLIPGQLNPSPRLLLGPGPSDVHPRVLSVMATPLMGHLDPQFLALMNETQ